MHDIKPYETNSTGQRSSAHGRSKSSVRLAAILQCALVPIVVLAALGWRADVAVAERVDGGLTRVAAVRLPTSFLNNGTNNQGGVAVDSSARRVIASSGNHVEAKPNVPDYVAVDADTGKVVATTSRPLAVGATLAQTQILYGQAVDETHHRLFVSLYTTGDTTEISIAALDTRTLQPRGAPFHVPVLNTSSGAVGLTYSDRDHLLYVLGLSPANSVVPSPNPMEIVAVNVDAAGGAVVGTPALMPDCEELSSTLGRGAPLGETSDGTSLYTVCTEDHSRFAVARVSKPVLQQTGADAGGGIHVEYYPGIVAPTGSVGLETAVISKRDRVVVIVTAGSAQVAYVFDGQKNTYIATPTLFSSGRTSVQYLTPSFGVNPETGRFYSHDLAFPTNYDAGQCQNEITTKNAITVGETRYSQDSTQQFATGDGALYSGPGAVMDFDPTGHNLWIEDAVIDPTRAHCPRIGSQLVAYHDATPDALAPTPPNFDASTTNIAEVQGQTAADLGAQASAFAYRYQLSPSGAEGPATYLPCESGSCFTPGCDFPTEYPSEVFTALGMPTPTVPAQYPPAQYHNLCNAGDRVATFAQIPEVTMDTSEVRAQAAPASINREWSQDVRALTSLDATLASTGLAQAASSPSSNAYPIRTDGYAIPYGISSCSDPGRTQGGDQTAGSAIMASPPPVDTSPPGSASVTCDGKKPQATGSAAMNGAIKAQANGGQVAAQAPFFVEDARTTAKVNADSTLGSMATADTVLDGINISLPTGQQVLHIGRFEVSATAWAHGRPGTNGTKFTCQASGVTLTTTNADGSTSEQTLPDTGPGSTAPTDCHALKATLQASLNQVFSGVLQVDFPDWTSSSDHSSTATYDDWVRMTSPGGYIAQVEASRAYQNSQVITLNQRTVEQPGMVITYLGDTANRHNRFVVSLGAVAVTATYGIYPLDSGPPAPGCDASDLAACGNPPTPEPQATTAPLLSDVATPTNPTPPTALQQRGSGFFNTVRQVAQAVVDGFEFLLQHPGLIPPLLAAWLFFSAPLYALSRRRALVHATA